MVLVLWRQRRGILARPAAVERLRKRLDFAKPLLPHTAAERRLFWQSPPRRHLRGDALPRLPHLVHCRMDGNLECTLAGPSTGVWTAIVLSSLIFGLGHFYLGVKQVPRTALVGLVLGVAGLIFQDRCGRRLCSTYHRLETPGSLGLRSERQRPATLGADDSALTT